MSELHVPEFERGIIRVFALTADPDTMDAAAMAAALGVPGLDMGGVELFPVKDLAGIGLEGYLTEGLGVTPEAVVPGTLDGIGDYVAIVHSAAFQGRSVTLSPRPPLELAVVYREVEGAPGDLMPTPPLQADADFAPDGAEAEGDSSLRRWPWLIGIGAVIGFVLAFVLVLAGGRG